MRLFCTVFEFWRVIRRKWLLLLTPFAFGTLVEVTPLEFRGDLWRQKTGYRAALFVSSYVQPFLPREAMLSAVCAVVVCLCVCHTLLLYQNG